MTEAVTTATTQLAQQAAQPSNFINILTALGGLAIPITAVIILVIVAAVLAAVMWGGFEFKIGYDKLSLTLSKREKTGTEVSPDVDAEEASREPPAEEELPPAPTAEIEAQATPPGDQEIDHGNTIEQVLAYIRAKTLADLDLAYEQLTSPAKERGDEFWITDYKKRRADLGADNGADAVRRLITDQPAWSYPYAVLIDWAIRDHDYETAECLLQEGEKRLASEQFSFVLSSGVRLKFLTAGPNEALRYCVEFARTALPERMKADMFFLLAELLEEAGHVEGQRVALEWAVALRPSDDGKTFSLAYSYARANSHWALAMWHYRTVIARNDGAVAQNNLAILLGKFDKAVQIEAYEKAAAAGDLYAPANLAHLLISDGYIAIAERLLKSIEDPGAAAEIHGSAAIEALAARRKLETRDGEIRRSIEQVSKSYRASLARAYKRLQAGGEAASGFYGTGDNMVSASIMPEGANVRVRIGTIDYFGQLTMQATCFAGSISNRADTVLGGYYFDVTLLDEGGGTVRLFQWPRSAGQDHPIHEFGLRKIEGVPPPPPPLPPPALPVLGSSGVSALLGLSASPPPSGT